VVIRAKAATRESDFVRLFDRHRKLCAALAKLGTAVKPTRNGGTE